MKRIFIYLSVFALIAESGYTKNNMTNKPFMISLKVGRENPPVQFETLYIEPVYLIIQNESDRSPNVELGLKVTETNSNKVYSHTLFYSYNNPKIYYPRAFENYTFSLEINNDSVNLVVEKLDFGKEFFLELDQKAVIGNFSIFFEDTYSDWSNDAHGDYLESREHFKILVSDDEEQKELRFGALYAVGREKKLLLDSYRGGIKDSKNELQLNWKNYQIIVLDAGGLILKLKVSQQNGNENDERESD